jgi:hypothetical protein
MTAASFGYDRYPQVPVVTSQDPAFLRSLLVGSSTGIVRIGVFGDSQEASPDTWGRHYLMEANALLVEAFGPASETVVLLQNWWDTEPDWLAATHNLVRTPGGQPQIPPVAVPPGMLVVARTGPADGLDAFHAVLMTKAERCVVTERIGHRGSLMVRRSSPTSSCPAARLQDHCSGGVQWSIRRVRTTVQPCSCKVGFPGSRRQAHRQAGSRLPRCRSRVQDGGRSRSSVRIRFTRSMCSACGSAMPLSHAVW